MKQSGLMSAIEATLSTAIGFGISFAAQLMFLPMLGVAINLTQNTIFAVIMTVISIGRGFALRRLFEALHIRHPISPFMLAVMAERRRQVEVEGWTPEHDDNGHDYRSLAQAGASYLIAEGAEYRDEQGRYHWLSGEGLWPWDRDWWRPKDDKKRSNLVRGVALGVAAGDWFDRAKVRKDHRVSPEKAAA